MERQYDEKWKDDFDRDIVRRKSGYHVDLPPIFVPVVMLDMVP
jgi:hypothetical protein